MIRMWMKSWGNGLEKGSHEWTQGKRFDYKTKWEFEWGYAFIINFLQEMCIFVKLYAMQGKSLRNVWGTS